MTSADVGLLHFFLRMLEGLSGINSPVSKKAGDQKVFSDGVFHAVIFPIAVCLFSSFQEQDLRCCYVFKPQPFVFKFSLENSLQMDEHKTQDCISPVSQGNQA